MIINFTKMHGAGNDFIMVNGLKEKLNNFKDLAKKLCDRHFGIGGDGLIVILPPEKNENDFKMRIFNNDGSEAEMCGNGIRCFAHYLQVRGLSTENKLRIETLAGIIKPQLVSSNDKLSKVTVNMGLPRFDPDKIPINVKGSYDWINDRELTVNNRTFSINCVSMGNPHTIVFMEDLDIDVAYWGELIENNPLFPEKTNVELIKVINSAEIDIKVWERGSGITLACGTGACASAVAGIKKGLLENKVVTHLPGGDLTIEWSGKEVIMTGPAETVFDGRIEIEE